MFGLFDLHFQNKTTERCVKIGIIAFNLVYAWYHLS